MVMTSREQHLLETQQTRAQAAQVLRELQEAKVHCEATLNQERRPDMFKTVAGRSSLDAAIAEARRLLDTLDQQIREAAQELDSDDRDVLGSDGLEAVVTAGRLSIGGRMGVGTRAVG